MAKYSVSKKEFYDCDEDYKAAQSDILDEISKLSYFELLEWVSENNADFILTD